MPPSQVTHHPRGGVVVPPLMQPLTGSAYRRAGAPAPSGAPRPGCPAFGGAFAVCSALAPLPSVCSLRPSGGSLRCGSGLLPAPRSAPRPRWGRCPLRVARAPSAPFGSLRGALRPSAGRLRPLRRAGALPPLAPAAAGAGPGPWRLRPPRPSAPGLGVLGPALRRPAGPPAGVGALATLRAGPGPSCAARAPPRPAPPGAPASALGRRRCVPPGGGCGGGCAAPFVPPPPPSVGIIRPDGPPSRAHASGQMATLDRDPLARFNVTKGRGWRVSAKRKSSLQSSYICAIIRLARETFPRWRSIHCQRGEALFLPQPPPVPRPRGAGGSARERDSQGNPLNDKNGADANPHQPRSNSVPYSVFDHTWPDKADRP